MIKALYRILKNKFLSEDTQKKAGTLRYGRLQPSFLSISKYYKLFCNNELKKPLYFYLGTSLITISIKASKEKSGLS